MSDARALSACPGGRFDGHHPTSPPHQGDDDVSESDLFDDDDEEAGFSEAGGTDDMSEAGGFDDEATSEAGGFSEREEVCPLRRSPGGATERLPLAFTLVAGCSK